ncbi:MAG: biotin transporter BioY [Thermoclostridium sp.]|nr:biotin transporter BioY [Thermoclostridium sp.]
MRVNSIQKMVLVALFSALMVVGAYLKIPNPFFPVFFTFQGVFCAFAGLLLGAKLGAAAVALYIIMGLSGLPVFSAPAGLQYVLNPTFGFLLGFLAAAWIIGKISEQKTEFTSGKAFIACAIGLLAVYASGIGYMFLIRHFYSDNPVGLGALISSMSLYFVKDLIFLLPVAVFSPRIKKRIPLFLD